MHTLAHSRISNEMKQINGEKYYARAKCTSIPFAIESLYQVIANKRTNKQQIVLNYWELKSNPNEMEKKAIIFRIGCDCVGACRFVCTRWDRGLRSTSSHKSHRNDAREFSVGNDYIAVSAKSFTILNAMHQFILRTHRVCTIAHYRFIVYT